MVRVRIVRLAFSSLAKATTIAIRYSAVNTKFFPPRSKKMISKTFWKKKGEETRILERR